MSFFHSVNVASTGLTAQRFRMDVISDNIANVGTTRTAEGGAYRRKRVILRTKDDEKIIKFPFNLLRENPPKKGEGVRVLEVNKDMSPMKMVYDPNHPDAIKTGPKKGFVEMPNVEIVDEMTDMINANRSYEANVAVVNTAKSLFRSALSIGEK